MTTTRQKVTGLAGVPSGRRSKYAVLVFWLVLVAVAGPLALKLTEVQDNDALGALPATAEASRAVQRAEQAFPDSRKPLAVAVYVREAGLTAADRAKVDADRAAFSGYADGGQVSPPMASDDGRALLLSFPVAGDADQRADAVSDIKQRLTDGVPEGLRTALTGPAGGEDDVFDAFAGMDTTLLLATAATVALLLLVTYRSPVLWLIPLVTVALANQLASAVVYLLAKHAGLAVDFQSQSILTVLVFGVGVDYALLLIARYREELRRHVDRHAAMAVALRRSVGAIGASAATVALGLLCLLAAQLPSTRGLGPVGAVGIVAALLAMTTLLPAVLVLFGRWLFWPFVPRYSPDAVGFDVAAEHGVWRRIAGFVGRRPRTVWLGTAAVLVALSFGMVNLSIGMPHDESFTKEVGSVTGQRMIEAHYPRGSVAPAEILAAAGPAGQVVAAARTVPGVAEVGEPEPSADGRWVRIAAVLVDTPDSDAALDTVGRLRATVHAVPGAQAVVGGDTAYLIDEKRTVDRDNWLVGPLVLAVVLVILVVLLRALVAPLLLLASVVLSYVAALGAAGLILDAMGYPKLFVGIPLQTFLFLVALGVDYTIFLSTRAREETARLGHRRGVLHALTVTGGVITSAGVVLAATFGALSVLPLVPSVQTAVIIGVGVLLDTFLVRSLLVPALALHLGRRTWWPSALARPAVRPVAAPPVERIPAAS
ncbi:MMPL family transporter [Micromonospora narathiwatensis]|uniref:Putative drug exporter of the RND superfamily n=1 Tax=Micromonospora narathiwatensis TaxID=299146 RepID=A0A1A9AFE3_9ACTN|nr:MMPL family transporter [Micromonospora narathiwatensis]SBT54894.1 putative drug exporter of the RND superfamily [Micromonospora narathiwatensis]